MSDSLKDDKLYGIGHNYQEKYKFPKGVAECFDPIMPSTPPQSAEAMAAYKSTAASPPYKKARSQS